MLHLAPVHLLHLARRALGVLLASLAAVVHLLLLLNLLLLLLRGGLVAVLVVVVGHVVLLDFGVGLVVKCC